MNFKDWKWYEDNKEVYFYIYIYYINYILFYKKYIK